MVKTSCDMRRILFDMPQPCSGATSTVRRMRRSRIPWSSSACSRVDLSGMPRESTIYCRLSRYPLNFLLIYAQSVASDESQRASACSILPFRLTGGGDPITYLCGSDQPPHLGSPL